MALISQVAIANMALAHIGNKAIIANFEEKSAEAKQLKLWYDPSRLQTLEAFDWSFARKRDALAEHSDDPPDEWAYRYVFPADCVTFRRIYNPVGEAADPVPYRMELSENGEERTILTNLGEASGIYTFDQQTVSLFSWHFVDMLAYRIAHNIAFALTGKRRIKADMLTQFNVLLAAAPAQNANEEQRDLPRQAPWIEGR